MAKWEIRYDRDGNPMAVGDADGYESRLRVAGDVLEMHYDDGLELTDECPLPILFSLLASTEAGRRAMGEALRASGWVCAEPGAEEVWLLANEDGRLAHFAGSVLVALPTLEEAKFEASPTEHPVRYVRAPEPEKGE